MSLDSIATSGGFAAPLLIDVLARLAPAVRIGLFAALGLFAGIVVNAIVRRVPVIIERAWQAELAAAQDGYLPLEPDAAPHAGTPAKPASLASTPPLPAPSCLPAPPGRTRRLSVLFAAITLGALVAWRFGPTWQSLGALGLAYTLVALALIDADTQLLPDMLTLPLLWAGLLFNLGHWFAALPAAVIGAMAGYLSLWLLYWMHRLWRGQEGMGFGDFKLAAALGAWFGWTALLQIFTIASLLALVVAGTAWASGRLPRNQAFAFGPFLAAAGLVTLLCGNGFIFWLGSAS
ncbi:Type 4 prepilin-like proteins leader peptide-processing enzyme [Pandoraea terrae]|uniref:Type 4 prepilin-like proteins leader peptide-processing enzyme n=1 Tax=Pandoraea terrae TaxID=1537710 RepID=A0A5E4YRK3_9BURK|nr:A24 family peptidase [Pandoraea terrae]VVE51008.1 Type 4 prepilin-like proteins leader peptide-processing enzyme [Pandoraea terrae]